MWSRKKVLSVAESDARLVSSGKKYKLGLEESVCQHDDTVRSLHRIIAVRDIPRHGVKTGDVGGYAESEFNLAHAGDAWIAKTACVSGHVKVKDNALVTDEAIVFSDTPKDDPYNWIGGSAIVKDKATVRGKGFVAFGNAQIMGSTLVESSKIFGSAIIKDDATVWQSNVKDSVIVSGNAYLFNSVVSGSSSVGGKSRIESSKIRENTNISGNVKIKENSICEGTNYLSGDLVIPANHYVINKSIVGETTSFFGVISNDESAKDDPNTEQLSSGSSFKEIEPFSFSSEFKKVLDSIEAEYKSYSTDIVKLIKYPLMADPSVPETQEFIFLLRKAKRLLDSKDEAEKQKVAEKLERAYMVAEANALKVSSSLYSENDRKKTEDAKVFINKACDELSTVAEKKIGFRSTMKALEGVIALPEDAVTAFREKIGLLEIEA